ncbi:hypothetical protein H0H92_011427 [Tricholoma furcatifolium]|nr:hypothetical protein H0H92_011427 [Tricholoma furcatifolium]
MPGISRGVIAVATTANVLLFIVAAITLVSCIHGDETPSKKYTYRGLDYPQTLDIPQLEKVHMSIENTVHYAIDTPLGIAEWNATLPTSRGMLYLGEDLQPFSISMFHQLRCLNIIRETIVTRKHQGRQAKAGIDALTHHCMNYIRQMVLCRTDLRLESVRRSGGAHVTVPYVTHTCNDWTAVYRAAEENYENYLQRTMKVMESGVVSSAPCD